MPQDHDSSRLSDNEKAIAGPVLEKFENLCLMRGHYKEEQAAFICRVDREEEDFIVAPIFLILSPEDLSRVSDMDGTPLSKVHDEEDGS